MRNAEICRREKREENRQFSLKGERKRKNGILPLSYIFHSAGFINLGEIWNKDKEMSTDIDKAFGSLSIDMVEVENQEVRGTRLPSFPRGQVLDN